MNEVLGIPVDLGDATATTLLVLVVVMILTDRLVTKARLNQTILERDQWRTAYENESTKNLHLSQAARDWGVVAKGALNTAQTEIVQNTEQGG